MHFIIKALITVLISALMQGSAINMISSTPKEAAEDFMSDVKAHKTHNMDKYMDNAYVNFLCNIEGNDEVTDRMREAMFKNFSYEIVKVKKKENVAAAKVEIKTNDFSDVMKNYEKEAYDYVMDNLYEDDIADKEKLNEKCLEIYVEQVEKCAQDEELIESTVYVPMVDDGYYGWNIVMTDEFMEAVMGNLEIPEQLEKSE